MTTQAMSKATMAGGQGSIVDRLVPHSIRSVSVGSRSTPGSRGNDSAEGPGTYPRRSRLAELAALQVDEWSNATAAAATVVPLLRS